MSFADSETPAAAEPSHCQALPAKRLHRRRVSGAPSVNNVAQPGKAFDQDGVETQAAGGQFRARCLEMQQRALNTPALHGSQGFGGARWARLDLDRDQGGAAPRDDIDFAQRRAVIARQYAIAFALQPQGRGPFGELPAPPARLAVKFGH